MVTCGDSKSALIPARVARRSCSAAGALVAVAVVLGPSRAAAVELVAEPAVGYAFASAIGRSDTAHGVDVALLLGLAFGRHLIAARGVYEHFPSSTAMQAGRWELAYRGTIPLPARLSLVLGVGFGGGLFMGCIVGDYCGGGGFSSTLHVALERSFSRWLAAGLSALSAFQTGMRNFRSGTLYVLTPAAHLRLSL